MPNEDINKQTAPDFNQDVTEDETSNPNEHPTAKSPDEEESASSVEERANQVPDVIPQETSLTDKQTDSSSTQDVTEDETSNPNEHPTAKSPDEEESASSVEERANQVPDVIPQETSLTDKQTDSSSTQDVTEDETSNPNEHPTAKSPDEEESASSVEERANQVPDVIPQETSLTDKQTDSSSTQDVTEDKSSHSYELPTKESSEKDKNVSLEQILEGLQKQVQAQNKQIQDLQAQIQDLQAQIQDLQEEINNPTLTLIKNKLKQQETEIERDRQELDSYLTQVQNWATRNETLQQNIKQAVESSYSLLSECKKTKEQLPENLQEELQKRQEALEIIGKMLKRLPEQFNEMLERLSNNANAEESIILPELPVVTKQELINLSSSEKTEDIQKAIAKKLKDVGIKRWQIISQVRDVADKYRKTWLHIIERKILPILDGINDGEKFNATLSQHLKDNYPDYETDLNNWFQADPALREILLKMLKSVKVEPIKVEIGKPIDYNRHEPFDGGQADENLNNEDIKEVIREGYEYEIEADRERLVLRSAQVVVVKNN